MIFPQWSNWSQTLRVTLLSVGGSDHKQAGAELGQAQLKLGLDLLFSFVTGTDRHTDRQTEIVES